MNSIKEALTTIKADLADTWVKYKGIFLAIIAAVVYLEFNKIREALLLYSGKKEIDKADSKDIDLKKQEDGLNTKANILVEEAKTLPEQEKPVTSDWYKNEK